MRLVTILFAFALPLTAFANPPRQTEAAPTGIVSLAGLRGLARPLLIFAPTPNDPQLEIQLRSSKPLSVEKLRNIIGAIPTYQQQRNDTRN